MRRFWAFMTQIPFRFRARPCLVLFAGLATLLGGARSPAQAATAADLVAPLAEGSELAGGFHIAQLGEGANGTLLIGIEGDEGSVDVVFSARDARQPAYTNTERCNVSYSAQPGTSTSSNLAAALDELVQVAAPNDKACLGATRARTATQVGGVIALGLAVIGVVLACRRRWTSNQVDLALVAGVLLFMVVATWLRTRGLGGPFCESASTQRIQTGASTLWRLLSFQVYDYRHPPATSLILHASLWFGHGEAWLRAPFVICAVATVPMLALLVRATSGPAPALVAAALYTLAGPMIEFGNDIGSHAVFFLVVPLVLWLGLRLMQRPSNGRAIALGLGGALALWTHYLAPLVLAAMIVPLALGLRKDRDEPRRAQRGGFLAAGIAVVAGAPALIGFGLSVIKDARYRAVSSEVPDAVWGATTAVEIAGAGVDSLGGLPAVLVLVAAVAGTVLAVMHRRDETRGRAKYALAAAALAGWIVPVAVLAATPWLRMRGVYMALTLPALLALAAHGLWHVPRALVSREPGDIEVRSRWSAVVSALAALVVVASFIPGVQGRLGEERRSDRRCPARTLAREIAASDITDVVLIHGHTASLLGYYLAETPTAHRDAEQSPHTSKYGPYSVHLLMPSNEVAVDWKPIAEERFAALLSEVGPLFLVDWVHVERSWPELEQVGVCESEFEVSSVRSLRCEFDESR